MTTTDSLRSVRLEIFMILLNDASDETGEISGPAGRDTSLPSVVTGDGGIDNYWTTGLSKRPAGLETLENDVIV